MRYTLLIAAAFALLLAATSCGGGGGGSGGGGGAVAPAGTVSYSVSGRAFKGPVKRGTVQVFRYTDGGYEGAVFAETETGLDGTFNFTIDQAASVIGLRIVSGYYFEESDGAQVDLSDIWHLRAAVPFNTAADLKNLVITPFTSLAASLALEYMRGGVPLAQAAADANGEIGRYFRIDDILRGPLYDFTSAESAGLNYREQNVRYSMLMAGLSTAAESVPGDPDSLFLTKALEYDVLDGILDGQMGAAVILVNGEDMPGDVMNERLYDGAVAFLDSGRNRSGISRSSFDEYLQLIKTANGDLEVSHEVRNNPPVVTDSVLPDAMVNATYYFRLHHSGGIGGVDWRVYDSTLPAGIGLNDSGILAGTPLATGIYRFFVVATDSRGAISWPTPLTISVEPYIYFPAQYPPAGFKDEGYFFMLQGTNTVNRVWRTVGGSLPDGLVLSSAGIISGTPTEAGTFEFTVEFYDARFAVGATRRLTIEILEKRLSMAVDGEYVIVGLGEPVDIRLSPTGGEPPYTVSVDQGALPPGVSFEEGSFRIEGTTTAYGTYSATLLLTDSFSPPNEFRQLVILRVIDEGGDWIVKPSEFFYLGVEMEKVSIVPGPSGWMTLFWLENNSGVRRLSMWRDWGAGATGANRTPDEGEVFEIASDSGLRFAALNDRSGDIVVIWEDGGVPYAWRDDGDGLIDVGEAGQITNDDALDFNWAFTFDSSDYLAGLRSGMGGTTEGGVSLWRDNGAGGGVAGDFVPQAGEVSTVFSGGPADVYAGVSAAFNPSGVYSAVFYDCTDKTYYLWVDNGAGGGTSGDLVAQAGELSGIVLTVDSIPFAEHFYDPAGVACVLFVNSLSVLKFWRDDGTGGGSALDSAMQSGEIRIIDTSVTPGGKPSSSFDHLGRIAIAYPTMAGAAFWYDDGGSGGDTIPGNFSPGGSEIRALYLTADPRFALIHIDSLKFPSIIFDDPDAGDALFWRDMWGD